MGVNRISTNSLDRVLANVGVLDAVKFSIKNLSDEPVAVRAPFSLAIGGEEEAGAA